MNARLLAPLFCTACAVTGHDVRPTDLGATRSANDLLQVLDQPGPVTVETVSAADWSVGRAGLINLKRPAARALKDGDEPVEVFFHVVRHPQRGAFLVDTGVEAAAKDPKKAAFKGLLARELHLEKLTLKTPLGAWLAAHPQEPPQAVFLTHMHVDHIWGMPDLPPQTRVFVGPGEAQARAFLNLFIKPNTDRALAGKPTLETWAFKPDPAGRFDGVIDVFGDGSFWALYVPGHTPGSTAFVARTPNGPVLMTGDTCHTRWGWEHDVEPGSLTADHEANARNLARLRRLAAEHPTLDVRLGHQR